MAVDYSSINATIAAINKSVGSLSDSTGVAIKGLSPLTSTPVTTSAPAVTSSSTPARAEVGAIGSDLKSLSDSVNPEDYTAGITSAYNTGNRLLESYQAVLERRREEEVKAIDSGFDTLKSQTGAAQNREYAGRSTQLVTSGGSFLGATQSHQGVLENLVVTHRNEMLALESKRQAAVLAAQNAYDDKQFNLAKEQVKLAKDYESDMLAARRNFANDQLAIIQESRAQDKYQGDKITQRLDAMEKIAASGRDAVMDADTAREIDGYYGIDGFAASYAEAANKAAKVKSNKDAIELDSSILDMRLKIPKGQSFTLNGVVYTGLKEADKGSNESSLKNDIASIVMDFQKQIQQNGWKGIDPSAYNYYREQLTKVYGAAAVLDLDKAIKDVNDAGSSDFQVDYGQ